MLWAHEVAIIYGTITRVANAQFGTCGDGLNAMSPNTRQLRDENKIMLRPRDHWKPPPSIRPDQGMNSCKSHTS